MPAHRVYLEPFAGGAAVLFAKPRAARETLNDLDGRVIRFWRALRDRPDELAAVIASTPYSRAEWQACRSCLDAEDDVEAARRFLVWVDQSFSREGTGCSPTSVLFDRRGRRQAGVWANLPDTLTAAASRLAAVALECTDTLELIARYDQPNAVIYCDPPYAGPHRLQPGKGYQHDDAESLWPALVDVLQRIQHAAVILSGYPCRAAGELGWTALPLAHKRTITARAASTVSAAPECVWLSPRVPRPILSLLDQEAVI
jgi:DNA adenine methylase